MTPEEHRPDPIAEHIARLVAEAPRFTPADIAAYGVIMAPALAALDAEADEAAVRASNDGLPT